MEKLPHCVAHSRLVEYVCPACDSLPLCEVCKREHASKTGHAPENCKEVGLASMHQHIQCAGGRLANGLAKGLRKVVKEFETGILREINRFQANFARDDEQCSKMRRLDREGRYAELYLLLCAKSLPADEAKNKAAMRELNSRLMKMLDTASVGLKKVLSKISGVEQYKPVFAAYKNGEVLVLKGRSYQYEDDVISALKNADMSTKVKAVYINFSRGVGDCVALELAYRLRSHPVSALRFSSDDISDAGVEVLARVAFQNKSLSAFYIASSRISDTGANAVAEAVRGSHSLTALYLNGSEISDSGAKAVAEAVKGCPLSVFYLTGSRISDSGAMIVAEAVKNCSLSAFCLGGHGISDAGEQYLLQKR